MNIRIAILFTLFSTLLYSQESINRLLNLQYINREAGIKELTRQKTIDELNKEILYSISAGDVLYDNSTGKKFLFIVDNKWDRIVYLKKNANYIRSFGTHGAGDGQFYNPQNITVLNNGTIYVADTYNERIVELLFKFDTETIDFVRNISVAGWKPRSIGISPDNVGPLFVGTEQDKLLVLLDKVFVHLYPNDFGNSINQNALENNGGYELDVDAYYIYYMNKKENKIYVLSYNRNASWTDDLFTGTWNYSFNGDFDKILKMSVHQSWPDNVVYLLFSDSKLRMKVMSSGEEQPLLIPGVENKPNAEFNNMTAIGMEPELGDLFIAERWRPLNSNPDWITYWYAIGPEIQNLKHQNLDYENENRFTFTIPDESKLTIQIVKSDGTVITQLTETNEIFKSGEISQDFNEYYNNNYLSYGTYDYRITAYSAYPNEGDSDPANPVSIINKSFEGGVLPAEGDIVSSSNYMIQGNTYTLKNYSNSDNYSPPPLYGDTWRLISTTYGSGGSVTDLSEYSSPYMASLKTSSQTSNFLSKTMEDKNTVDYVGVKLSYDGITTEEVTTSFTSYPSNPGVCPVLYINNKPYVNLLPQSPYTTGLQEDRITIPSYLLTEDSLNLSIRESGTDISIFKSFDLFLEDVEKGTNLIRLSSGMSFEYKAKKSPKIMKSQKLSSQDYLAGDTLFFSVEESGNAVLSASGYMVGLEPMDYCFYFDDGMHIESIYQVTPPSEPDYFVDAAYLRAYSYESNFLLKDTLSSSNGQRDYYMVFHIDMHLESFDIYYLEDNNSNKTDSKYFYPTNYKKIENSIALQQKKLPKLKPDERIDLSFKLPKIKENYQRYGYLKVVGRYDPENISNLLSSDKLPKVYKVYQNFPNPFNPITTIPFSLIKPGSVKVNIYNLLGQKIKTFEKVYGTSGFYSVKWNGRNKSNTLVSTGLYIYKVDIFDDNSNPVYSKVKKMLFLK